MVDIDLPNAGDVVSPEMPDPSDGSDEKKRGSFFGFVLETLKIVVIALAIIIPVRYFLIQPFFVRGDSMSPNYHDGDYLIIDEISYDLSEPARGDVIVFHFPGDERQYYIKRIIGLPGETVEIADGKVFVYNESNPDGFELDESAYLESTVRTPGEKRTEVAEGEYFVLGDNRTRSSDSRSFGSIDEGEIVGRSWIRAYPFDSITTFATPSY